MHPALACSAGLIYVGWGMSLTRNLWPLHLPLHMIVEEGAEEDEEGEKVEEELGAGQLLRVPYKK